MDIDEDEEEDPNLQQVASPEYRNLIAIPAGKVKGGMREWLMVDPTKVRRLSLSEQELEKAIPEYGKDIVRYDFKLSIVRSLHNCASCLYCDLSIS